MVESLRVLSLLLHKNWLTRKRQWLMSLIAEILLPVGIIAFTWAVRGMSAKPPKHVLTESHYRMQNLTELVDQLYNERNNSINIFYAPMNTFTDELMMNVNECFMNKSNIMGFNTESEFVAYYLKKFRSFKGMGVIFEDNVNNSTKNLQYKIRGNQMGATNLYNVMLPILNFTYYYTKGHAYTQVQICLDESFVKMKSGVADIPTMFIQELPYPPYTEHDAGDALFRMSMSMLLVVAFFIPLFIETSKATNEKFLGINVLMCMNGISNALNLLSWLISGLFFLCIFCVIPILIFFILPVGDGLAYLNYGNPILLFLVFAAYVGHLLAYGVHVSSYFSRSLLVMFALLMANVLTTVLKLYAFKEDNFYLVPYVGILLPNLLLQQAMDEVSYYESIAEGIRWSNMFVTGNAAYKFGGSIGMILILSVIGMIVHYILACYIYVINPGRYGVRKSPLFFLKCKSKKYDGEKIENLRYENMVGKPFEPTTSGAYTPGIQIRNLTKAYRISLFNRGKVHALKGVSVDFYKGQITSLLGHNGAGKTTMMSILTGMMSPTDGLVMINSKDMAEHSSEIMNDLGLCTQENMLFPSLTVMEQMEFFAKLKRKGKSKSVVREEVKAFLHKLKLYEKRNALPKQLSGGQKRRVCLGMALVGDNSTLILDEPTSGLDPESRRVIWDILLKMRGQKTILISTHDMEEADILGDRIAILHTGQLRSCGTSLFLKKLIGQGNVEVTLSIEPHCDHQKVCAAFSCEGILINKDGSKIVLSVPYTSELPDQLDNLERKKKELGVSGFSVSLISLEQVFLKVTQENDGPLKPHQAFTSEEEKLKGSALYMQSVRALVAKKMTYTLNNMSIVLLKLLTVLIALLAIALILRGSSVSNQMEKKLVPISLDMYNGPDTYLASDDKIMGDHYKNITRSLGGKVLETTNSSLTSAMIKYAKTNLANYENHLIAAAEFNETDNGLRANAFYSDKATFSLPISVNLIWNTVIRNLLGADYSISLSSQELPNTVYSDLTIQNGIITAVVFVFQFCSTLALFVVHPLRESSKGVKQLQRMTGVSGFTYWGTMFIFDFVVYMIIVGLIVVGFLSMDYLLDLHVYGVYETWLLVLLLILFAINTLPFVYIFSFINGKISMVVRLLTYIALGIVTLELVMYAMRATLGTYEIVRTIRPIQKNIFLLVPYVSFFHSQMSFYLTAQVNARCVKMPNEFYDSQCAYPTDTCCKMGCYDGKCQGYKKLFTNFEEDITLEESLIYLCITPFLYFGILALLEGQFFQTLGSKFRSQSFEAVSADEQVQREKSKIYERIQALNGLGSSYTKLDNVLNGHNLHIDNKPKKSNDQVFLVYDLQKRYKNLTAVKDVSFGVNRHECFGLLGVNGAGKSTTFRMMTGGEVPDHGTMYLGGKDIRNNRNYFLSRMGYCPQQDAIIKSLNSYDHLRLFGRLRGIPEDKIENEVQAWIERLNLTACALQPSGTYSGGNKRRLNIAMALIGHPNLVLMDEPTTGVDPGARRSLWNVIKSCQMAGQAIVLTSHSMEECEALCNRLAIMVSGRLVCIGASEELKQRFGAGYDIQIRMDPEKANDQLENIKNDMTQMLEVELTDENLGYLMYHVAPNNTTWRKMYDVMNEMKSKYDCIEDFSVLSSSLEQLFLLFARAANGKSPAKSVIA